MCGPFWARSVLLCCLLLAAAGCQVRSISNSGYGPSNPLYKGELSAYDILGVELENGISRRR